MSVGIPEPKAPDALRPQLAELQKAHAELIAAYVDAVRRGSYLPGLFEAGNRLDGNDESFRFGTSGPIARALLAIHVRDRLKLLERLYTQLRQTISPGEDAAYATWLEEAAEGCRSLGESMSTAQAGLRALQIPGLSLVLIALLQQSGALGPWILGFLVPVAYLLFVAAFSSFRLKRELLFHGAGRVESEGREAQEARRDANAYRCEESLTACLGYGRPREGQLDYFAVGLAGLVMLIAAVALGEAGLIGFVIEFSIIATGLGLMIFAASRWRRRRWR